jgi:hypothetical protein
MYLNGQGVPQNRQEAVAWFRKAADQGNAEAQTHLGFMYERGEDVSQDYVTAHMWFNLAAAQGEAAQDEEAKLFHNEAVENRDSLAANMTPAQIAEAQKMASEWKPN